MVSARLTPCTARWSCPPVFAPHSGQRASSIGIPHSPIANYQSPVSTILSVCYDLKAKHIGCPLIQLYQCPECVAIPCDPPTIAVLIDASSSAVMSSYHSFRSSFSDSLTACNGLSAPLNPCPHSLLAHVNLSVKFHSAFFAIFGETIFTADPRALMTARKQVGTALVAWKAIARR